MMALLLHCLSVLVLAILVSVACRLGRFRPALCHALWLVVLVKLLVPPVVAWPWEALDLTTHFPAPSAELGVAEQATGPAVARFSLSDARPIDASPGNSALDPWGLLGIAALSLWLAGILALAGHLAWRVRGARRVVATGSPAPEWLNARLREVCATLGMNTPKITVIPSEAGGISVHYFGRPTLVLSASFLESIETSQWEAILTHEMAHLKRRDHWVAWLILAAGLLWWWNPCLWWVRRELNLYSELACDAWVVDAYPDERRNYAETMVRVLTLLSERADTAPLPGLALWSPASQERRIWMVMKGTGACRLGRHCGIGLVLVALLLIPACVDMSDEIGPPAAEESPAASAPSATWTLPTETSAALEEGLRQPIAVQFENTHLADVVASLHNSYGVNIVIDPRAVQPNAPANTVEGDTRSDGIVPYINLKEVALGDGLKSICRPMKLVFTTYGNVVWITSEVLRDSDSAMTLPLSSRSGGSQMVDDLQKPINVEFENIHLRDALEFIQDQAEINIVLDKRAFLPKDGVPLDGQSGDVTDGMIRHVALNDVSVAEALYTITRILNLSYRADDGFVYIATPELVADDPSRPDKSTEAGN